MTLLLLAVALGFAVIVARDFRTATLVYLGLFQIVPITFSLDFGTSFPLVTLVRLLLLVLIAGYVPRVLTGRIRLDAVPFWLPMALFACALTAANLFSEERNSAGTLRVFSFVVEEWLLLVIVSCVLRTRRDAETALTVLLAGVLATLVFAGYELAADRNPLLEMAAEGRERLIYDYSLERRFGLRRIQSMFRNPLDYGIYLSLLLPVAAAYRFDATGWRRAVATVALLGGAVAVALTLSRTAIYSLFVCGLAFLALRRRFGTMLRGALTAAVLVALVTLAFDFPLLDYLVRSAVAPEQLVGDLGGSTLSSFFAISGNHLAMALQHPVFGRGLATLPPAAAGRFLDPDRLGYGEQGLTYLLVEAGVLGLGAFLLVLASLGHRLHAGSRLAASPSTQRLTLATLSALIGWIVSIELAGVWHFSLLLVLVTVAVRMQEFPVPAGTPEALT